MFGDGLSSFPAAPKRIRTNGVLQDHQHMQPGVWPWAWAGLLAWRYCERAAVCFEACDNSWASADRVHSSGALLRAPQDHSSS